MAQFNADAVAERSEQPKSSGRIEVSVVPTGVYDARIVKVDSYTKPDDPTRYPDIRDPAKRRISIVTIYYEILAGEHQGDVIKQYLSMNHPSEKAMDFSHAKMSWICKATGVRGFRDHETGPFDALVGKTLGVRVEKTPSGQEFWEFRPMAGEGMLGASVLPGVRANGSGGSATDRRPAGRSDDW